MSTEAKTTNPNYITYGGDYTVQPPYQLDRPSMYTFWFQGDCAKLQAILDQRLNFADNGKRYIPFTSNVMLIFADTPHAYSGTEREQGYITMNEAVFWILAVEQEYRNGDWKSERLVWFIPYIFVDNPIELVAGREVAGFPKALAEVVMPGNPNYANSFAINVPSYAKYGINSHFMSNRLLTIETESTEETFIEKELTDLEEAEKHLKQFLGDFDKSGLGICDGAIEDIGDRMRLFNSFVQDIKSAEMPAVFLKQFRSASNDGKACYQAIVESAFAVNGFHGIRILRASDYKLTIDDVASFPVATDLGLTPGQSPSIAMWVDVSFANTPGEELWVSS